MKSVAQKVKEKYNSNITGDSQVTFADGHVGGCNIYGDPGTEYPKMWNYIVDKYDIKSMLDIGCGFGFHLQYFRDILKIKAIGIEGSSMVAELSNVSENIIAHDYTTGLPSGLDDGYDLCWSIEFVEHVDHRFEDNFLDTFSKCKYVAMTHAIPHQGGYHHVNCQPSSYWIERLEKRGFVFDEEETLKLRKIAQEDFDDYMRWQDLPEEERQFRGFAAEATLAYGRNVPAPFFATNGLFFRKESK